MPDEEPFMGLPGELPELEHMLVHRGKVRNIYDPSLMFTQPDPLCTHPNGVYYGDTNPPTYKCPECGAFYLKGEICEGS